MPKTKLTPYDPTQLQENLHRSGRRLTPQRMIIFEAVQTLKGHVTADEVYQQVQPKHRTITRATVYRTLEVLRDEGLVTGTDLGQGRIQFEVSRDHHHHHLVCLNCGMVQEINGDLFNTVNLHLKKKYKFQARIEHFAIFGLCEKCTKT